MRKRGKVSPFQRSLSILLLQKNKNTVAFERGISKHRTRGEEEIIVQGEEDSEMGARFIHVFCPLLLLVYPFSGTFAKDTEYGSHNILLNPAFQLQISKLGNKIKNAHLVGEDHNIHRMLFPQTEPESLYTSSQMDAVIEPGSLDTSGQMDAVIEPESVDLPQMEFVTEPASLDTLPQMDVVNPVTTVPTFNPSTPTPTTPAYNPLPTPATNPTPTTTPVTNPDTTPTNPTANPAMGGAPAVSSGQSWCVASPSASQTALQVGLDYACGYGGADCSAIQQGGSCFNPDTLRDHASYAYNNYYQKNPVPTSCDFSGTAMISNTDPSTSTCQYPSSSTSSVPTPNMNNPTGPQTGIGSSPPSFGSSPPVFGSSPPSVFGSSPPDYSDSSSSSVRMPSSFILMICLPISLACLKTLRL